MPGLFVANLGVAAPFVAMVCLAAARRDGADLPHRASTSSTSALRSWTRQGRRSTGSRVTDFELYENGKKQEIRYFARGDAEKGAQPPLHVGLLFDTSGSMGEDIRMARSAAIKFLNRLLHAEDMTIVDFDTEVRDDALQPGRVPAARRAAPLAQARRLDGALRRARHLSHGVARSARARRSSSSTPTAATRAAR